MGNDAETTGRTGRAVGTFLVGARKSAGVEFTAGSRSMPSVGPVANPRSHGGTLHRIARCWPCTATWTTLGPSI